MTSQIPEISASTITKNLSKLKALVGEFGKARIVWREQKPGGQVLQSMIVIDEELYKKEKGESK